MWKEINGFEEYKVSEKGVVLGKRGKPLSPFISRVGYKMVSLLKNGKLYDKSVHRLVALAFLENPNKYDYVNHKDENKLNNNVSNLEWCTIKYNNNYGTVNQRRSVNNKGKSKNKIQENRRTYIRCIETGEIHFFNEWNRLKIYNTRLVCLGKIKHSKGLHFEYVMDKGKFL